MGLFDNFKKVEVRSLENPNVPVSADNFLHLMGWGDFNSRTGWPEVFKILHLDGVAQPYRRAA